MSGVDRLLKEVWATVHELGRIADAGYGMRPMSTPKAAPEPDVFPHQAMRPANGGSNPNT